MTSMTLFMTAFLRRPDESKSWRFERHLSFTKAKRTLGVLHEAAITRCEKSRSKDASRTTVPGPHLGRYFSHTRR